MSWNIILINQKVVNNARLQSDLDLHVTAFEPSAKDGDNGFVHYRGSDVDGCRHLRTGDRDFGRHQHGQE